jgi:hypothetical protein
MPDGTPAGGAIPGPTLDPLQTAAPLTGVGTASATEMEEEITRASSRATTKFTTVTAPGWYGLREYL